MPGGILNQELDQRVSNKHTLMVLVDAISELDKRTPAGLNIERRIWSQKDLERKKQWDQYLDEASEDDFTENVLVPLLQQCAFQRINVAGHRDKALEYGKDIWMKLQLPTSH